MKEYKLTSEIVPSSCWYSNVRSNVTKKEWDIIRKKSYAAADNKCEICGDTGKNQGYKHAVECHEIWHYDDEKHVQKLIGLISLCPLCHMTKHIGRAMAMGRENFCYTQLSKVNKWTKEQIQEHVLASFEVHKERSKHEWTLDISLLEKAPYNIKLKPFKNRIFEVKKYKKKPKKKKVAGAPKKVHPKAKMAAALKPKTPTTKRPPKSQ
jgi:hypothetical protein